MRLRFKFYFHLALIALGIYLFINIEVILWHLLEPDGFWGLIWFYSVSTTMLLIFTLFLNVTTFAIMNLKTGKLGCLGAFGIVFLNLLGLMFYYGPTMILPKYLSDKYKYINQSEEYISEGRFQDALKYAVKIYDKVIEKEAASPILVFQYLYENSNLGIRKQKLKEYNAEVNYAFCLQETGVNMLGAEKLYKSSINTINDFFNSDPELLLFPQISLTKIYLAQGDNQKAEKSFRKLLSLTNSLNDDDIIYSVTALFNYAFYSESHGDFKRALELRKRALDIYDNSGKSKESFLYLIILLKVADDYIRVGDFSASRHIYSIASEFVEKHEDDLIYIEYLNIKSQLLESEIKYAPTCDSVKKDIKTQILDWFYDAKPCQKELKFETEETLTEIIEEIKSRQGEKHIDYASALYNLGTFYYRNGEYRLAISNLQKALVRWSSCTGQHFSKL